MALFLIGMILFLGIHTVPIVAGGTRQRLLARFGENGWKGMFSVVSLIGFVLLIHGYGISRQSPVPLYTPAPWLRHVTMLLMLPVFPLLIAAYLPGRIKAAIRHPMLLAVMLWAAAHLLANGTLADVVLFGGFLVWAIADRVSVARRGVVVAAKSSGYVNDLLAVGIGLIVYVAIVVWLHVRLVGVPVITMST